MKVCSRDDEQADEAEDAAQEAADPQATAGLTGKGVAEGHGRE